MKITLRQAETASSDPKCAFCGDPLDPGSLTQWEFRTRSGKHFRFCFSNCQQLWTGSMAESAVDAGISIGTDGEPKHAEGTNYDGQQTSK